MPNLDMMQAAERGDALLTLDHASTHLKQVAKAHGDPGEALWDAREILMACELSILRDVEMALHAGH